MPFQVDGALYPDRAVPSKLDNLSDRVDFLVRLCAAWDFGRLPDRQTIEEIRRTGWKEAVESARLLTSCAYHLLRSWHDLPPAPYLGRQIPSIRDDPSLEHV